MLSIRSSNNTQLSQRSSNTAALTGRRGAIHTPSTNTTLTHTHTHSLVKLGNSCQTCSRIEPVSDGFIMMGCGFTAPPLVDQFHQQSSPPPPPPRGAPFTPTLPSSCEWVSLLLSGSFIRESCGSCVARRSRSRVLTQGAASSSRAALAAVTAVLQASWV